MSNERIITPTNKLQDYSVTIGDISIIKEAIIHIEINYKNDTPIVTGSLLINDIYDINNLVDWSSTTISIYYKDLLDGETTKTFNILEVKEYEHSVHKKAIEIKLQDTFSYTLQHSFLSKGYNGTVDSALSEYVEFLELNTDYSTEFSSTESRRFTVPKNQNNLEFFIKEFNKDGFKFYQTRDFVYLKSLDDLLVENLPIQDNIFTDVASNQLYKNIIIASRASVNKRKEIVDKTRSFAYDFDTKSINYDLTNDRTQYYLNDRESDIQYTNGYVDKYQQHLNFNDHLSYMKESYLKQNEIEIVTNGFAKNDLNQVFDVFLRGNIGSTDFKKGNMTVNGKYISKSITDKIIGDTFIQKIILERADSTLFK